MATKLLVEGLDWGTTDEALRVAFVPFGRVLSSRVARDWETGRSRGFGHVTFAHQIDARAAIATMDGAGLEGKVLRVMLAPDEPTRTAYRSVDYEGTQGEPAASGASATERRVYRSADFGYADGPTESSDFRSADFDGGRPRGRRERATTQRVSTPDAPSGPPSDERVAPVGSAPEDAEPVGDEADATEGPRRGTVGDEAGGKKSGGGPDDRSPFG